MFLTRPAAGKPVEVSSGFQPRNGRDPSLVPTGHPVNSRGLFLVTRGLRHGMLARRGVGVLRGWGFVCVGCHVGMMFYQFLPTLLRLSTLPELSTLYTIANIPKSCSRS